jgi:hypothetical protein
VKRKAILSCLVLAIVLVSAVDVRADSSAPATTQWQVYAWIGEQTVDGVMILTTSGEKVTGQFRGNAITGQLVDYGNQFNGNYNGPRGEGWITLHFHNGRTGFDGKVVGHLLTPSPAPAAP